MSDIDEFETNAVHADNAAETADVSAGPMMVFEFRSSADAQLFAADYDDCCDVSGHVVTFDEVPIDAIDELRAPARALHVKSIEEEWS